MSDYQGIGTLENLKDAVNYNNFLERELKNFIGTASPILDFGAGNGEFAGRLRAAGIKVECLEVDPQLNSLLKQQDFKTYSALEELTAIYERVYSFNVLEHIEDDVAALKTLHGNMSTGGQILIYVPAFMALYSEFDKKIGHFRRYTKAELTTKLLQAGYKINRVEYADSLGFFAWFILSAFGKLSGEPSPKLIKIYDRFIFPLSRVFDIIFKPFFGKNLLVIASK